MGQSWQTCTRRRLKHTKTHRPEGSPPGDSHDLDYIVPLLTLLLKAARSFL